MGEAVPTMKPEGGMTYYYFPRECVDRTGMDTAEYPHFHQTRSGRCRWTHDDARTSVDRCDPGGKSNLAAQGIKSRRLGRQRHLCASSQRSECGTNERCKKSITYFRCWQMLNLHILAVVSTNHIHEHETASRLLRAIPWSIRRGTYDEPRIRRRVLVRGKTAASMCDVGGSVSYEEVCCCLRKDLHCKRTTADSFISF